MGGDAGNGDARGHGNHLTDDAPCALTRARDIALFAQFDISAEEGFPLRRFRYELDMSRKSATRSETIVFPSPVHAPQAQCALTRARDIALFAQFDISAEEDFPLRRFRYVRCANSICRAKARRDRRQSFFLPPFTRRRRISNCPQGQYIERGASRPVYRAAQRAAFIPLHFRGRGDIIAEEEKKTRRRGENDGFF